MQFWSRFSKDAFALGMGSLVCFTAPHCLRMGLSWSRKDSCCSPSRLHCACPCTITAFSWRRSLFGKCSQRSDLPQGAEVPGEAPGSRLQLCSDWSQRLSHEQPPPCFLREPKPHLALCCWCLCNFSCSLWMTRFVGPLAVILLLQWRTDRKRLRFGLFYL